jgi:GMP synthase (glutamine-hydrolysing)
VGKAPAEIRFTPMGVADYKHTGGMPGPIVIVKAGDTLPAIAEACRDYDAWFRRAFAGPTVVCQAHRGERPPAPRECAGVVITGSPRSVLDDEPWMRELCDYVRRADDEGVPVLGVCFGHQLVGHAFGCLVERNPRGWELGTREVSLTAEGRADPLFAGMPERFTAQMSHRDQLASVDGRVRVLAENGHSAVQAIAVGDHVRGVQFHPEADPTIARLFITARAETLREAGLDPDRLAGTVTAALLQDRVLLNFEERFVRRA